MRSPQSGQQVLQKLGQGIKYYKPKNKGGKSVDLNKLLGEIQGVEDKTILSELKKTSKLNFAAQATAKFNKIDKMVLKVSSKK